MPQIQTGNAKIDAAQRGWFVGHFIDEKFGIRHSDDVEMKWAEYTEDEERPEWVTGETRTAICILITGYIELAFRDKNVALTKPGDFVMWGPGTDHKWRAKKGTTALTVRWPSIER